MKNEALSLASTGAIFLWLGLAGRKRGDRWKVLVFGGLLLLIVAVVIYFWI